MPSKVEAVKESVRRIASRWLITTTQLTQPAFAGDSTLNVVTTRRFKVGDVIVLRDANQATEPPPGLLTISDIPADNQLTLAAPLQTDWPLNLNPSIFKTVNGQYVKAIFYGEPAVISQQLLPAVTVEVSTRHSDWMTTRASKEHYNIEVGIFVEDSGDEAADRLRDNLTDLMQEGLKRNIYPLLDDYEVHALLADCNAGDLFVKVADTSKFGCVNRILIEDPNNIFESTCTVVDSTTLQLSIPSDVTLLVANGAQLVRMNRFIFNSWPADITYGKINKGTLMKASVISWFAEEMEAQFQPFSDTQLR